MPLDNLDFENVVTIAIKRVHMHLNRQGFRIATRRCYSLQINSFTPCVKGLKHSVPYHTCYAADNSITIKEYINKQGTIIADYTLLPF